MCACVAPVLVVVVVLVRVLTWCLHMCDCSHGAWTRASNSESERHALTPKKTPLLQRTKKWSLHPREMLPRTALTAPSQHGTESLREPRNVRNTSQSTSQQEHKGARKDKYKRRHVKEPKLHRPTTRRTAPRPDNARRQREPCNAGDLTVGATATNAERPTLSPANKLVLSQSNKRLPARSSEHQETPGLETRGPRHPEDTVHDPQEAGEASDDA